MDLKCWAHRRCLVKRSCGLSPCAKEDGHRFGSSREGCWGEALPFPCLLEMGGGNSPSPSAPPEHDGTEQTGAGGLGRGRVPVGMGLPTVLAQRPLLPPTFWQVKPVVSQFLRDKQLPYNEDSYLARFRLFLHHYEELMVQTPPITELVGLQ